MVTAYIWICVGIHYSRIGVDVYRQQVDIIFRRYPGRPTLGGIISVIIDSVVEIFFSIISAYLLDIGYYVNRFCR